MKNVIIVAPYMGQTMRQCITAFCQLKEIKLGIVSHQKEEAIPEAFRTFFKGHYQVNNSLDVDELEEAVSAFIDEWGHVDRLIGYLEHQQSQLAEVRSRCGIPGMKREAATNFRNKNAMKTVLRDANLPVANQSKIHSFEEAQRFISQVGYPIVLKPLAGVGSKNTLRVQNEDDLIEAMNLLLPSLNAPIQAEEFIQGDEHTMESVTINGQTVWQSSTYYLPGPLKVIENPWMQYCVLLPRELHGSHVEAFKEVNAKALQTLGMETGLSHMEWFMKADNKPIISEVGARPPGVNIMPMLDLAHNVNMWEKWAALMVHDRWDIPEREFAVGCAFLRAQGRGNSIVNITGVAEAQEMVGEMVMTTKLPRVGQVRSTHYEGDGYVIVRHPSTETVVTALKKIITTVKIVAG
jgi:biotin carboxylase